MCLRIKEIGDAEKKNETVEIASSREDLETDGDGIIKIASK